jgi:hypothetical protein
MVSLNLPAAPGGRPTSDAMVLAFPRERCRLSAGKIAGPSAAIIILPCVRIERHSDRPKPAARTRRKSP